MRADQAKGGILLLTGGDGRLNVTDGAQFTDGADNVLIRNRDAFAARGYNVMLVDLGTDLAAAVGYMSRLKAPVTVIGTSKGTERLAQGLAKARVRTRWCCPRAFSQESGPGDSVQAILGTPSRLPPALVIHHREDHCRWTRPAGVEPFKTWAGSKVEVAWLNGGVDDQANPLPLQRAPWLRRPGRGIRGPRHGLCREVGSRAASLLWRNPGRSVHGGAAGPCPY